MKLIQTEQYLLLIDEEAICKTGELYLTSIKRNIKPKSEGVIQVGDKILAYFPLIVEAKELDLPLLPNPFEDMAKKEAFIVYPLDIRENRTTPGSYDHNNIKRDIWIKGYKAAQSKQFSLEDMKRAIDFGKNLYRDILNNKILTGNEVAFAQDNFIQSLSTQQFGGMHSSLPKEFIPEYKKECNKHDFEWCCDLINSNQCKYCVDEIQVITNSEGKQEICGKYVY